MNIYRMLALAVALLALPMSSYADDWKDESGKRKGKERREFKEEYWDGNCKVERKMEKNGDFKEERKCKAPRHVDYREREEYVPVPAPVYRTREPEISVDVRIRP